ncbi:MAG TPA: bifunctional hydroxymethylpyrimidine kinase/phosphomethylpyrimidine kinase, partial [Nitriliruptorales bacterium]
MIRPRVLVIGGTDSSGGAGIQADLRALAAIGADAAVAVTAVTAQTMTEVRSVTPVAVELVRDQVGAALDEPVGAVKVGLLPTVETVEAVGAILEDLDVPIVVDPVRRASTGDALGEETDDAMRQFVLPHATVATPNRAELASLGDRTITDLVG